MDNEFLTSLRRLSDDELVARVKDLAARERVATSALIAHLAELDTRDIHLREGYGSLFAYCRDALSLSEHEAYNRIEVARAARRFPVILEMLAEGTVSLTRVRLLAPHLTPESHRSVLASARGKRKIEVEEIVARLAPRPDVAAKVRKLPTPRDADRTSRLDASSVAPSLPVAATPQATVAAPVPSTRSAPVVPLAEDRYKLQMTISGDTLRKLRLAKDMLRHVLPTGGDAAILDRALSSLLTELAREKLGATDRPRPPRQTAPRSRHIPAGVRRTVWIGISAPAPSRARRAGGAASVGSSSSTTFGRSRRAARRPCPTSSFAAAATAGMTRRCSSPRRTCSGTSRLLRSEPRSSAPADVEPGPPTPQIQALETSD
jgi:hypothetical protein